MTESYIEGGKGHTAFVGPDAVGLYTAVVLKHGIALYAKAKIIPTRGLTIGKMMQAAGKITGKSYKRGDYTGAIHDLDQWILAMHAAMPIVNRDDV
jgi:hypothetical protein